MRFDPYAFKFLHCHLFKLIILFIKANIESSAWSHQNIFIYTACESLFFPISRAHFFPSSSSLYLAKEGIHIWDVGCSIGTFMIFAPSIKHLWGGKLWCVRELSASLEEKHWWRLLSLVRSNMAQKTSALAQHFSNRWHIWLWSRKGRWQG